jgi:hypothetical protein
MKTPTADAIDFYSLVLAAVLGGLFVWMVFDSEAFVKVVLFFITVLK